MKTIRIFLITVMICFAVISCDKKSTEPEEHDPKVSEAKFEIQNTELGMKRRSFEDVKISVSNQLIEMIFPFMLGRSILSPTLKKPRFLRYIPAITLGRKSFIAKSHDIIIKIITAPAII